MSTNMQNRTALKQVLQIECSRTINNDSRIEHRISRASTPLLQIRAIPKTEHRKEPGKSLRKKSEHKCRELGGFRTAQR